MILLAGALRPLALILLTTAVADGRVEHPDPSHSACPGRPEEPTKQLEHCLLVASLTVRLGDPIVATASLKNKSKTPLAIDDRAMFRIINHERLPSTDTEFTVVGQVLGHAFPSEARVKPTILSPGGSLSRTIDLAESLVDVLTRPGAYKISLEYCYHGPSVVDGVNAPAGCVSSNEVVLNVDPT